MPMCDPTKELQQAKRYLRNLSERLYLKAILSDNDLAVLNEINFIKISEDRKAQLKEKKPWFIRFFFNMTTFNVIICLIALFAAGFSVYQYRKSIEEPKITYDFNSKEKKTEIAILNL